jgi:hypothetical protein
VVKEMVERIEGGKALSEIECVVVSVELEHGVEDRRQYHIKMDRGNDAKIIHEWIGLSPKATEETIQQGSVMDRFLTQLEICVKAAKSAKTVGEAMKLMVGKKFRMTKVKLGKDFNGQPAREYYVPVALLA